MEPYQRIPSEILGYLAKDSLPKIKFYLRKNHLDLSNCSTPAGASVLHVATELGSELCLRYLMKTCPGLLSKPDSLGELPLHKAVTYLISASDHPRVMHICVDVVESLLASYPQALRLPNFEGCTPMDLLDDDGWVVVSGKLRQSTPCEKMHDGDEGCSNSSDDSSNSSEYEFECEDEETNCQWLKRSEGTEEQRQQQRRKEQRQRRFIWATRKALTKEERSKFDRWAKSHGGTQKQRLKEIHKDRMEKQQLKFELDLEPEVTDYICEPPPCNKGKCLLGPERPKKYSSLQLLVMRAQHESAMRHALQRPADAPLLGLAEFPWPTGCGSAAATAADMVSVLLCDVDMADIAAVRARSRKLQKTWHPDKIRQKFGAMLLQSAWATILDKVNEISQLLTAHMLES